MFSKRAIGFVYLFAIVCALLVFRLAFIVVQNGKTYETMAKKQQHRQVTVRNIRADIYDRNGAKLTDVSKQKLYLSDKGEVSPKKGDSNFVLEVKKRFPKLAGHIVGYTSSDGKGVCGIEKQFDFVLKDKGSVVLEFAADATGSPLGSLNLLKNKTKSSAGVKLTIDAPIQKAAEAVMDKHIKKGAAVVLDCKSFDILAMVSRPDYNGTEIEKYCTSSGGELLNRAIMGYNAGSVFKIITASSALEKSSTYAQRYFECKGSYKLADGSVFECHEKSGHGVVSFEDAFAYSCNCSFYVTGLELGGNDIINKARDFGMGAPLLNVDIGENPGNLPKKASYSQGDILNISIGQGEILVSPLQCAVMAATVANGGLRHDVNLVSGYTDDEGVFYNLKTNGAYQVIQPSTALALSNMMKKCVQLGTAKKAFDSKADIAGKTGSAETGWVEDGNLLVHGWFVGFFPFSNPQYAVAVFSEGGHSGAGSCVEPFIEIAEKINEIYPFKQ